LPLIFALAGANRDGDRKETTYRWDLIKIPNFNPPTLLEGGFATALANDGSRNYRVQGLYGLLEQPAELNVVPHP